MISKMQGQMGQPKMRLNSASNNVNSLQGIGGAYDVDTNQYRIAAQAHAQHIAAHQQAIGQLGQGLKNVSPYKSSQNPHPQPMPKSMISKITKGLGFK
jgi:hypothetical protein